MAQTVQHLQRTCLGCGARDEQAKLLRLSITGDGEIAVARREGRGGYLHREENCWAKFLNRKSHYRAFHMEISRAAREKLVRQLKAGDWE